MVTEIKAIISLLGNGGSTYFVHDPVGIFNSSFNNLLDSLRVVFIRMNPETLAVQE